MNGEKWTIEMFAVVVDTKKQKSDSSKHFEKFSSFLKKIFKKNSTDVDTIWRTIENSNGESSSVQIPYLGKFMNFFQNDHNS